MILCVKLLVNSYVKKLYTPAGHASIQHPNGVVEIRRKGNPCDVWQHESASAAVDAPEQDRREHNEGEQDHQFRKCEAGILEAEEDNGPQRIEH